MSSSIPAELGELSNLEYLSLGNNDLDSVPDLSMSSMMNTTIIFDVKNNKLNFADIVPNIGVFL